MLNTDKYPNSDVPLHSALSVLFCVKIELYQGIIVLCYFVTVLILEEHQGKRIF